MQIYYPRRTQAKGIALYLPIFFLIFSIILGPTITVLAAEYSGNMTDSFGRGNNKYILDNGEFGSLETNLPRSEQYIQKNKGVKDLTNLTKRFGGEEHLGSSNSAISEEVVTAKINTFKSEALQKTDQRLPNLQIPQAYLKNQRSEYQKLSTVEGLELENDTFEATVYFDSYKNASDIEHLLSNYSLTPLSYEYFWEGAHAWYKQDQTISISGQFEILKEDRKRLLLDQSEIHFRNIGDVDNRIIQSRLKHIARNKAEYSYFLTHDFVVSGIVVEGNRNSLISLIGDNKYILVKARNLSLVERVGSDYELLKTAETSDNELSIASLGGSVSSFQSFLPDMGSISYDLTNPAPGNISSEMLWFDHSGFGASEGYEHDIVLNGSNMVDCTNLTNTILSSYDDCSPSSVSFFPPAGVSVQEYVDTRWSDSGSNFSFSLGFANPQAIQDYEIYSVVFDVEQVGSATSKSLTLTGAKTYDERFNSRNQLREYFCLYAPLLSGLTYDQACFFQSSSLRILSGYNVNLNNSGYTSWASLIGLTNNYRTSDAEGLGNVTYRIRDVYYANSNFPVDGIHKVGVPYNADESRTSFLTQKWGLFHQVFYQPEPSLPRFGNGQSAIIYNKSLDKAFLVKGQIWQTYKNNEHGFFVLGAPTASDVTLPNGKTRQPFERGCIVYDPSIPSTQTLNKTQCADNPEDGGVDFTYTEINGIVIDPDTKEIRFVIKSEEADIGDDIIDLEATKSEFTRFFLQALAIPNWKHYISLDYLGNGQGQARLETSFKGTDLANSMLFADVAMKQETFGVGLDTWAQEWEDLLQNSSYSSEYQNKFIFPSWALSQEMKPNTITAHQTGNSFIFDSVTLYIDGPTWLYEPNVDTSSLSLSSGALADIENLEDQYKQIMENLVDTHNANVLEPAMNADNSDPRFGRLRSALVAVAAAQWYKTQVALNSNLPLANVVDSEDLTGFEVNPPFDQQYWDGQAAQLLWTGPCNFLLQGSCYIEGGASFYNSSTTISGPVTAPEDIILESVLEELATVQSGTTHYSYGDTLRDSFVDLVIGDTLFDALPDTLNQTVFSGSVDVTNIGDLSAPNVTMHIIDQVTDTQGVVSNNVLNSQSSTINATSTNSFTVSNLTLPSIVGTHKISVVIDQAGSIEEIDELNNTLTKEFYLELPKDQSNDLAISFRESDNAYLSIADAAQTGLDLTGDFTAEMWLKLNEDLPNGSHYGLFSKWQEAGNQRSYRAFLTGSSTAPLLGFEVSSNGINTSLVQFDYVDITASDGYVHLALTYDASAGEASLYLDGQLHQTKSGLPTSIYNGTAAFRVGDYNNAQYLDALVDDLRIWNTIRTAESIDYYKDENINISTSGLVSYWQFDGNLSDSKATGNALSKVNDSRYSPSLPYGVASITAPAITITEPNGSGDSTYSTFIIKWNSSSPTGSSTISLYYGTSANGEGGNLIANGLYAPNGINMYTWDVSNIPVGSYYIYAYLDDSIYEKAQGYSNHRVIVNDPPSGGGGTHLKPELP